MRDLANKTLAQYAYTLADELRSRYLDKGMAVPMADSEQAILLLMEAFAISQAQAESALATGFFETR